jgi:hypothetical protein
MDFSDCDDGAPSTSPTPFEVRPGVSAGRFTLGTPLKDVVLALASNSRVFGASTIDRRTWAISVPRWHSTLRFDPRAQVLRSVEIDDIAALELLYKEGLLCGRNATPTFVRLYEVLGPTFAGNMRDGDGQYVLSYPGLDVVFKVPAQFRGLYADGNHPMSFPDGTTPVALKLVVREMVQSKAPNGKLAVAAASSQPPSPNGLLRTALPTDDVVVRWGRGVDFSSGASLVFGQSPQDVVMALGLPQRTMVKHDDRMTIHGSTRGAAPLQYMQCYPAYGIDVVFAAATNALEKIVLHNAVHPHEAFAWYHRCWYHVPIGAATAAAWLALSTDAIAAEGSSTHFASVLDIEHGTKWATVATALCRAAPPSASPLALPRQTPVLPRPLLATTAEGTLRIVALNGIVFTTVQETDDIATVTLVRAVTQTVVLRAADDEAAVRGPGVFYDTSDAEAGDANRSGGKAPRVNLSAEFDMVDEDSREPTDDVELSSTTDTSMVSPPSATVALLPPGAPILTVPARPDSAESATMPSTASTAQYSNSVLTETSPASAKDTFAAVGDSGNVVENVYHGWGQQPAAASTGPVARYTDVFKDLPPVAAATGGTYSPPNPFGDGEQPERAATSPNSEGPYPEDFEVETEAEDNAPPPYETPYEDDDDEADIAQEDVEPLEMAHTVDDADTAAEDEDDDGQCDVLDESESSEQPVQPQRRYVDLINRRRAEEVDAAAAGARSPDSVDVSPPPYSPEENVSESERGYEDEDAGETTGASRPPSPPKKKPAPQPQPKKAKKGQKGKRGW